MTRPYRSPSNRLPDRTGRPRPARSVLDTLMTSVGDSGLAAAARDPGLLALVDQHSAAVRDSLSGSAAGLPGAVLPAAGLPGAAGPVGALLGDKRPVLSATALAGYAEGVREAAREHGWQPPAGAVDWAAPDWVLVRLLAVCALARDARLVR